MHGPALEAPYQDAGDRWIFTFKGRAPESQQFTLETEVSVHKETLEVVVLYNGPLRDLPPTDDTSPGGRETSSSDTPPSQSRYQRSCPRPNLQCSSPPNPSLRSLWIPSPNRFPPPIREPFRPLLQLLPPSPPNRKPFRPLLQLLSPSPPNRKPFRPPPQLQPPSLTMLQLCLS